jgi:hypothetical protein
LFYGDYTLAYLLLCGNHAADTGRLKKGGLLMQRVCNFIFFRGLVTLLAILLSNGLATAATEVTNVQPNADFQNDTIVVDASVDCAAVGDLVVFEATQGQGRHTAIAVFELPCTSIATVPGPFSLPVFEGLKFRSGPFTLLVRIFNADGTFAKGQGFHLKGK